MADMLERLLDLERRVKFLETHATNSDCINGELNKTEKRLNKTLRSIIGRIQTLSRGIRRIEKSLGIPPILITLFIGCSEEPLADPFTSWAIKRFDITEDTVRLPVNSLIVIPPLRRQDLADHPNTRAFHTEITDMTVTECLVSGHDPLLEDCETLKNDDWYIVPQEEHRYLLPIFTFLGIPDNYCKKYGCTKTQRIRNWHRPRGMWDLSSDSLNNAQTRVVECGVGHISKRLISASIGNANEGQIRVEFPEHKIYLDTIFFFVHGCP